MKTRLISAVAGLVLSAAAANASPISISLFSVSDYKDLYTGYTELAHENFERFREGNVDNGFSTAVGTFASAGGKGTGGTVKDPNPDLNGWKLAVRDGVVYGRSSTTDLLAPGGDDDPTDGKMDMFLDSNDTKGFIWNVTLGGSLFNRLFFVLTDPTDVGAKLSVTAAGVTETISGYTYPNAQRLLVVIDFESMIDKALVTLKNDRVNDGMSIDDISVGVSPVPLPAPALMLLAGLGGLAALRRKRAAA